MTNESSQLNSVPVTLGKQQKEPSSTLEAPGSLCELTLSVMSDKFTSDIYWVWADSH